MPHWLVILKPARPGMPEKPTEQEESVLAEHFAYLRTALGAGKLVLAGRSTDKNAVGLVIFEAPDEAAARAFMEFDPAVRHGVMLAELKPYRVALCQPPEETS
jgi:uncharacterized protein YciI